MPSFYISKDGVDSVDRGTEESPAQTVSYVVGTLGAGIGDTIYFFAGYYTTELDMYSVSPSSSLGTLENYITISKEPSETEDVVFEPSVILAGGEDTKSYFLCYNPSGVHTSGAASCLTRSNGMKIAFIVGQTQILLEV